MIGAVLGDMIGAPYEFDRGNKTKDFPLFTDRSVFTDDSVMTIAVGQALMNSMDCPDQRSRLVGLLMQDWGQRYPDRGYGGRFQVWLYSDHPEPYNSCGNGSAMRVSSAGWLYPDLDTTLEAAEDTAVVTHNHPEGIKGAVVTAGAIYLARTGKSKAEIKKFAEGYGYDLSRTCDEIRPTYHHVETCQETVPQAITAFLEGKDFEDVIRTAVSLGGDCDTLTCIAGSIAEGYFGVPDALQKECRRRIPKDMNQVLDAFEKMRFPRVERS